MVGNLLKRQDSMNKETTQILDYIQKSGHYLEKIEQLRDKHINYKDFFNMLGYVVMEIVNEEKKFVHLSRKNIDLELITERYF
jgi:hypothetical protein